MGQAMSTGYVWVYWDCACDEKCGCKADGAELCELVWGADINQTIKCHKCEHDTKVRYKE